MAWIPGQTFHMGSDRHYLEEGPSRPVRVDGFWMDRHPVTNRSYAAFVEATGYQTLAEIPPDPKDYPGSDATLLRAGALVFHSPEARSRSHRWGDWWSFVPGANWRSPDGVTSMEEDRLEHPVVQVAYPDAEAYATWAGKALPTEAEWECAARGGLDGADFAWGSIFMPDGRRMANTWPGQFPIQGEAGNHRYRTSEVGAFPPNCYGLHDMIGNVWEWTSDWWTARHPANPAKSCCVPTNPRVSDHSGSFDPMQPSIRIPRRVLKGGSHLCAPNYCRRYRPASRHPQTIDTATAHIGFRCISRSRSEAQER